MTEVSIRDATASDATAIAAVHIAAWRAAYAGLLPAELLANLSVTERATGWSRTLAAGESAVVADADGVIVGFASFGPSRDDGAAGIGELNAIYLHPDQWSTGVGHLLHEATLARLAGDGYDVITLWVLEGNQQAIRFYERHGWAADGAVKVDDRGEVAFHERRYRRAL